jgi:hypothetical protein
MLPTLIDAAAIRHRGVVYSVERPGRHHDVIRSICAAGYGPVGGDSEQGFVTTDGRFVDRREASLIARMGGQVMFVEDTLFSEDVW